MDGIFQIYAMNNAMKLSADAMRITTNGNLFNRWLSGIPDPDGRLGRCRQLLRDALRNTGGAGRGEELGMA